MTKEQNPQKLISSEVVLASFFKTRGRMMGIGRAITLHIESFIERGKEEEKYRLQTRMLAYAYELCPRESQTVLVSPTQFH